MSFARWGAAIALAAFSIATIGATRLFADGPSDCYRLVLKNKTSGVIQDMGCPVVDCDPGPGTINCVEGNGVMVDPNMPPGGFWLDWLVDIHWCQCGEGANACQLITYVPTGGTQTAISCKTNATCTSPGKCETNGWQPYSSMFDKSRDCVCR